MTENEKKLNTAHIFSLGEQDASPTFYAGAGRGETVLRMTKALEQGVALLVLTGEEGSGKTVVCRVLEREASRFCFTVFLPKTVESFEDVVKKVARQLGLAADGGNEGKNIDKTLDRLTAHLKREASGLLIIFDEAENIYLATLERIRKMVDRITEAGVRLHIVFSGRQTFLENYEQLSICRFKTTDQLQFELEPLSEQETGEYLETCTQAAAQTDRRVFNDEIIRNIHSLAQGNFRKTTLLAEESLRTHGDDTSFMVLLESVKDDTGDNRRRARPDRPRFLKRTAHYLPWLGGFACILVLLFFLVRTDSDDRRNDKVSPVKEVPEKVAIQEAEVKKAPEEQPVERNEDKTPPLTTTIQQAAPVVPPAQQSEEKAAAGLGPPESLDDGPAATVKNGGDGKEQVKVTGKNVVEVIRETPAKKKIAVPPERVKIPPPLVSEAKQIRLEKPMKIKRELVTDKENKGMINLQPPTIKEHLGAKDRFSVDQLLQRRIAAGSAWNRKEKEDVYTMQLMALTDKNAEDNLRKMLAQPRYRQESNNFFIFKKSSGSPIVFVFYGEYASLAMAREAQSNLPPFLQAHQPYAISVKGAMAKVKR